MTDKVKIIFLFYIISLAFIASCETSIEIAPKTLSNISNGIMCFLIKENVKSIGDCLQQSDQSTSPHKKETCLSHVSLDDSFCQSSFIDDFTQP